MNGELAAESSWPDTSLFLFLAIRCGGSHLPLIAEMLLNPSF